MSSLISGQIGCPKVAFSTFAQREFIGYEEITRF